ENRRDDRQRDNRGNEGRERGEIRGAGPQPVISDTPAEVVLGDAAEQPANPRRSERATSARRAERQDAPRDASAPEEAGSADTPLAAAPAAEMSVIANAPAGHANGANGAEAASDTGDAPVRRRPGRPRKRPLPEAAVPVAVGED
nr:hypothetical protein [Rhizobiaceae bacterium]